MAVKRLDLSALAPILHTVPMPEPAHEPASEAQATPSLTELLSIAPGDTAGRVAYFDTDTRARGRGPALITSGATLMDYRDTKGRRIHRAPMVVPPSTAARIARACGGRSDTLNGALIALAEYGLAALDRDRASLIVRNAPDVHRAARLTARRTVIPSRAR